MAASKVIRHNEVKLPTEQNGWQLCFQNCTYRFDDGRPDEKGYRFIWRKENGKLQAARGQARIPSAAAIQQLTKLAADDGWYV